MKKIYILFLVSLLTISCSSDDEVIDAPTSIENTRWYKYFNKKEVESASGGYAQGRINSMEITFVLISDKNFEMQSYTSTTTQGGVRNTFYGTYTYNSTNGEATFKYNNTSIFGNGSDKGVFNGDKMTLGGKYTFEKQ